MTDDYTYGGHRQSIARLWRACKAGCVTVRYCARKASIDDFNAGASHLHKTGVSWKDFSAGLNRLAQTGVSWKDVAGEGENTMTDENELRARAYKYIREAASFTYYPIDGVDIGRKITLNIDDHGVSIEMCYSVTPRDLNRASFSWGVLEHAEENPILKYVTAIAEIVNNQAR